MASRYRLNIERVGKVTITKRRANGGQAQSADEFIARAPDAAHGETAAPARRRKEVISLGVDVMLLKRLDAYAAKLGLSRAAAINLAMSLFLSGDQ